MSGGSSRWRSRVFGALLAMARGAERSASALLHVATGALTEDELGRRTRAEYEGYRRLDGEVRAGLLWWEADVYARFLRPGDRVLIVGAGTGRDVLALAAAGYEVVGVDATASVLAQAQQHLDAAGLRAMLVAGAIENGVAVRGPFDVVIFSDYTYSFITSSRRRLAALARARDLLAAGGHIVLTYFGAVDAMPRRAHRLTRLIATLTASDLRLEEGDVITAAASNGVHYHHVFTAGSVEEEVGRAGLRVVYHRQPPDVPTVVLASDGGTAGKDAVT